MTNYDPNNNRPGDLLDECLRRYGLDKKRALNDNLLCYYRTCHWNEDYNEWIASWHLGGAHKEPDTVLVQTFQQIIEQLNSDAENGLAEKSTNYDALVLVASGTGQYIVRDENGTDFDDFPESLKKELRRSIAESGQPKVMPGGSAPTRVVSIITLEGIATDLTVFVEGEEPNVSRIEQWYTPTSEGEPPEPNGPLEGAMLSMFTFTQLLRETLHYGRDLSLPNVLKTATQIPEERGGAAMTGMFLKMIGSAIQSGLFDADELFSRGDDYDD